MNARQLAVSVVSATLVAALAVRPEASAVAAPRTVSTDSITSPAGPGSAEPNLAVGRDGRVYLSWFEPADSGFAFRMAVFDGRSWSEPRTIRTGRDFFVNWADFPSIHVLDKDRLAVHWLQRTGRATYAYGVRVALSNDDGRSWSAAITPHRDTSPTEHGFVSLWTDGGKLGAAWLDGRKYSKDAPKLQNEMTVMTTTLDAGGKLDAEITADSRVCDCCQTSAAMTDKGPIVVYRDRSAEEIRDISYVRRVRGKWTSPATVHHDGWKIAACPVNGPAIDAIGSQVALAWFTAANEKPRVNLAMSTSSGEKFSAPIRIDDGNPAGRVDVITLRDGGALVSWIERMRGDTAEVRLRRVDRKGKASAPITVASSSAARASGFPRMVIAGEHVFFAWTNPTRPSSVRVARLPLADIR